MSIIGLLVAVVIVGLIVWVVETVLPLPEPFRTVVRVIGVIIVLVLLIQFLGLLDGGLRLHNP
jgi:hypothetical protein